jgi:Tol biopolymer transport system component
MRQRGRSIAGVCLFAVATGCTSNEAKKDTGVERVVIASGDTIYNEPVYSPDGQRLAYRAEARAREAVYVANADGSRATRVSEASQYIRRPLWSPDGSNIAFTSDLICPPDVFVVPAAGGASRRMTKDPGLEYLRDRRPGTGELLFASNKGGDYDLYAVGLTDEQAKQVTALPGNEGSTARWSPDGSRLAFNRAVGGKTSIWVASPGSDAKPLTTEGYEVMHDWSPDGSMIAYTSARTGRTDVWVMPAAGGEPRQLTNDIRGDDLPRFSPDGKWIAYTSTRGGQPDIWIVPVAGGESIRVTDDWAVEGAPAWSRDGSSITFTSDASLSHLWVISADGGGGAPRQLTTGQGYDISHVISPDGTRVAFVSDRTGSNDIFVVDLAGGEPVALTSASTNETNPEWSPDGSKLLFLSRRGPTTSVFVIPSRADSAGPPAATKLLDWTENQASASWSPDGSMIAFVASRGSTQDVWVVGADGSNPRRVTTNAAAGPTFWSPDGRSLVYSTLAGPGGESSVYVVPVTGGKPTRTPFDGYLYAIAWTNAGILFGGSHQCTSSTGIDSYLARNPGEKPVQIFADTLHDTPLGASPDGSWIGVIAQTAGNTDIILVPSAGGAHRTLTTSPANDTRPRWTPDGKWIVYASTPVGNKLVTARVGSLLTPSPSR